jgi:hypothetical protein
VTHESALKLAAYNLAEAAAEEACSAKPRTAVSKAFGLGFRVRAGLLLVYGGAAQRGRRLTNDALAELEALAKSAPTPDERARVSGYLSDAQAAVRDPRSVALMDEP